MNSERQNEARKTHTWLIIFIISIKNCSGYDSISRSLIRSFRCQSKRDSASDRSSNHHAERQQSRADLGGVWAGRPWWEKTLLVAMGNALSFSLPLPPSPFFFCIWTLIVLSSIKYQVIKNNVILLYTIESASGLYGVRLGTIWWRHEKCFQ